MNSIRLFKNTLITSRILSLRYYALLSDNKHNFLCYSLPRRINTPSCLNISLGTVKCISNYSSRTKDDSFGEKGEKIQKILEDVEMQNILRNFANDFGVDDNESNELLDDIRKNIDEDYGKESSNGKHNTKDNVAPILGGGLDHKYKEFSDIDNAVIHSYDYKEDTADIEEEDIYHIDQELKSKLPYNDLKRGITGVFDIDEMIKVLHNESLLDITTISIPKEFHYADFLVLATAKSERHSEAVVESIKKIYKQKKNKKDPFVIVEGKDVPEWKAMDMGNIVLHIFLEEKRTEKDIESLWLLDSEYDSGGNAERDTVLDEQLEFVNSLQKSSVSESSKEDSS